MADDERQIKRARLIGPKDHKTVWQKMHYERAQEMQKAREDAEAKRARQPAITATRVLGAPRPEFGPPSWVQDGGFIDQRPLLPRTRRSDQAPISWARLPQPDPKTQIRVTTMAPTRAFMDGDRVISSQSVLGAPRPEFGPPSGIPDIRSENGHSVYRPNNVQKNIMKEHLGARGLPTKQVDELKFVSGLDEDAGIPTWLGYHLGGEAVTQGNTVYVHPEKFIDYAGFYSKDPFEEAYHAAKFEAEDGAGFYRPYVLGIMGGILSREGSYDGIPDEAFAKGAAKEMYRSYRYRLKDKPE